MRGGRGGPGRSGAGLVHPRASSPEQRPRLEAGASRVPLRVLRLGNVAARAGPSLPSRLSLCRRVFPVTAGSDVSGVPAAHAVLDPERVLRGRHVSAGAQRAPCVARVRRGRRHLPRPPVSRVPDAARAPGLTCGAEPRAAEPGAPPRGRGPAGPGSPPLLPRAVGSPCAVLGEQERSCFSLLGLFIARVRGPPLTAGACGRPWRVTWSSRPVCQLARAPGLSRMGDVCVFLEVKLFQKRYFSVLISV